MPTPDPVDFSTLTPEDLAAERVAVEKKIAVFLARDAAGEDIPKDEGVQLQALVNQLTEIKEVQGQPSAEDAVAAAKEALEAPAVDPAEPVDPATAVDPGTATDPAAPADPAVDPAAPAQTAVEREMAAAAAASVAGKTAATEPAEPGDALAISGRASLEAISMDGHGTRTVVTDRRSLSTHFKAAAEAHTTGVFLESARFDTEVDRVTGNSESDDWDVIFSAQAAYEENLAARADCADGSCADECNIVNEPSLIFCEGGTPFLDRMPSIPANGNCSVTAYIPKKPMTTEEWHKFILCQKVGEGEDAKNVSGWELPSGEFVEQKIVNGVPMDKPSETLDIDCFEKKTKTLTGVFKNIWIKDKDLLCDAARVDMALARKIQLLEKELEIGAIADAWSDAVTSGHAYKYAAGADGHDASNEWLDALNCTLPGETEHWCVDPSNYTPIWSQGMAKFLAGGRGRSASGNIPTLAEILERCGISLASGFASACPLPGADVPQWYGTPGSIATLTPGNEQTHTLLLVDFRQLPKFVGPSRRARRTQRGACEDIKNADFMQIEDFMCPFPVGPVPMIGITVTACNSGTTTAPKEFTKCAPKPPGTDPAPVKKAKEKAAA